MGMEVKMEKGRGPVFPAVSTSQYDSLAYYTYNLHALVSPSLSLSLTPLSFLLRNSQPLNSPSDIAKLTLKPNIESSLGYVFNGINLTRKEINGRVPLIGFSGGPWTLMAYMVEGHGTKTWEKCKTWLYNVR